jgi:nucleoside-diphosphate-sugar epimerase
MRVFFSGGSGKAGRDAIAYLVEKGHRVVYGDVVSLGHPGVADLRIDNDILKKAAVILGTRPQSNFVK